MLSDRKKLLGSTTRLLCGISAGALLAASPAIAQSSSDIEQVVVTGSRVATPGFTSPTPVTAISEVQLQQKAITNVVSLIQDIPQFQPQVSYGGGITNTGYNSFNLRGLGGNRTLVLVDGRRVADTSPIGGGFDVDVLPAAMIKNVDIVTGGASAAYGSDAVAGVVNIQLDNSYEGVKGRVQVGETQYGDSQEWSGSLTGGTSFAGDRGHAVLSVDATQNYGAQSAFSRPWGSQGWAILANPAYKAGNGQVRNLILPNTTFSQATDGGLITAGPLKGIQFLQGGRTDTFQYGTNVGSSFMTGGGGTNFTHFPNLSQAVNRYSGYGHVSYDVSDDIQVYADALYTRSYTRYGVVPNYNNGDLTIKRDNAYLPANVAALMDANKITSFLMGRTNLELGLNLARGLNEVGRYAFGAKGKLGGSWTWDAVVQYTGNHYYDPTPNNRNNVKWLMAVDAVANPAVGGVAGVVAGQPVCRSTIANPTNGCVPANVFGPGSVLPVVKDYVDGTSFLNSHSYQQYFGANLQGAPLELWAGPISVATGFEYRHEGVRGTDDPTSLLAQWRQGNPQPVAGSFNVIEGYGEVVVPLLKDVPLAKSLDFNGAMRETSYSISGNVTTWKVGLTWEPADEFRLRGTVSRDIRAPNINELFATRNQQVTQITNDLTNQTTSAQILTGGNINLKPEIGKTYTGGIVYTPGWLPGLQASVDYYSIQITGAISTLAAQVVIDNCQLRGITSLCPNITFDPVTGQIASVFSAAFNAQTVSTHGVDVEAAYSTPLDTFVGGWDGDLSLRYLGNYLDDFVTVVSGVRTNTAGQISGGAGPHWRMNLSANYSNDPWSVTVLERWIQGGHYNNTYVQGVDINNNLITGRFYTNLTVEYRAFDKVTVYGKINNATNANPPIVPNALQNFYASSQPYYDVLGRSFALGVRFQY